jgi:hypothetical protein
MTTERLKELHQAQPFRPFIIHLADGRQVKVTHPEAMARRDSSRTFVVLDPADRAHHIDLLLVTDLVVDHTARSRKNGNGKH